MPLSKRHAALTQALDTSTALGQVFNTKMTGSIFKPNPSRGILLKVKRQLEEVSKIYPIEIELRDTRPDNLDAYIISI